MLTRKTHRGELQPQRDGEPKKWTAMPSLSWLEPTMKTIVAYVIKATYDLDATMDQARTHKNLGTLPPTTTPTEKTNNIARKRERSHNTVMRCEKRKRRWDR